MSLGVLTLTYARKRLLKQAVQSCLNAGAEMLVLNDEPGVTYRSTHPSIRVVNLPERCPTILDKLLLGFRLAPWDYVYRLDDDDLLLPDAMETVRANLIPGYDIYRSREHIVYVDDDNQGPRGSINNGNVYRRDWVLGLQRPEKDFGSAGEDAWLTFQAGGRIHEFDKPTMIYRWGCNTYHVSGMGSIPTDQMDRWLQTLITHEPGEWEIP